MTTTNDLPIGPAMEAMEKQAGARPGYRRAHARGFVLRGTFQATSAARALTTAEHFQGAVVPVQVRFSNAGGNPFAADRASAKTGKAVGMGIRFLLSSGAVASWAAVNLPAFPARTPDDFVRITRAQRPFLSLAPNPFKLIAYLISRPSVLPTIKAIAQMKPVRSFATVTYNGIHTYFLVNGKGDRRAFRYSWRPRAGDQTLGPAESQKIPEQYLLNELRQRLTAGKIEWDLYLQFPREGDLLLDASRAWPDDRETCHAGTLAVVDSEPDQRAVEGLVFDPTGVVPGLELSDDPLLRFRAAVYSESYRRRSQEARNEAAPSDMGQ